MSSAKSHKQRQRQPAPPRTEQTEQTEEKRTGGKVVHLHTAHPRVPIPYVTPGDMFTTNARKVTSTATALLPPPRRLALYGVLGGMSVAGAIAWPVAVAVGAATEVISREQAARHREDHERMERGRTEQERTERAS
ncbi:hypothetical protein [Streptomyces viridochromogenes]|nr:hypothetical protein [Streptomyces viridochromogenes]